jgi:hypothetical protein
MERFPFRVAHWFPALIHGYISHLLSNERIRAFYVVWFKYTFIKRAAYIWTLIKSLIK